MTTADKGLAVIERLASDDLCERLSWGAAQGRPTRLSDEEIKTLGNKLSLIYRIAHSLNADASCAYVHANWRKEIDELYQKYKEGE